MSTHHLNLFVIDSVGLTTSLKLTGDLQSILMFWSPNCARLCCGQRSNTEKSMRSVGAVESEWTGAGGGGAARQAEDARQHPPDCGAVQQGGRAGADRARVRRGAAGRLGARRAGGGQHRGAAGCESVRRP